MGNTAREKYERMKQVFRFLITNAPFLIDDKALERCADATPKEKLKIQIDSVRKSLGIEDMEYVELLTDVLYGFQEKHEKALEEQRKRLEEDEANEADNGQSPDQANATAANANNQRLNNQGPHNNGAAQAEAGSREDEEEVDENKLRLDSELLTAAL